MKLCPVEQKFGSLSQKYFFIKKSIENTTHNFCSLKVQKKLIYKGVSVYDIGIDLVHCGAVQYSVVHCIAVKCSVVHHIGV